MTPRTRLLALSQVLWTTGRVLPVHELREQTGVPVLVDGAQSRRRDPRRRGGLDFLTVSGQKWLCGPDATGALVVADPERLRVARPSYFSQTRYEPDGQLRACRGRRALRPGWIATASLAGLLAALAVRAGVALRARRGADRALPRAAGASSSRSSPGDATLVAFRAGGSAGRRRALAEAGVVVRELPGTGLVRASFGWWTSDEDLERLVELVGGT